MKKLLLLLGCVISMAFSSHADVQTVTAKGATGTLQNNTTVVFADATISYNKTSYLTLITFPNDANGVAAVISAVPGIGSNASNSPSYNKEGSIRLYAGNTMEFNAAEGVQISKLVFTLKNASAYADPTVSVGSGSANATSSPSTYTWTSETPVSSVKFTANTTSGKQFGFSEIEVTYTSAAPMEKHLGELTGSYNGTNIEANAAISVDQGTAFSFAADNADEISVKVGDAEAVNLEVTYGKATWTPGIYENKLVTVTATMNGDTPETKILSFNLTVIQDESIKDVITANSFNYTTNTYATKTYTSPTTSITYSSVYAYNNNGITFNTKNSNGKASELVVTSNVKGYKLKKVDIAFSAGNSIGVEVYAQNAGYTPTTLANAPTKKGELIGTIGTGTSMTANVTVVDDKNYTAVALYPKGEGVISMTSITLTWEQGEEIPPVVKHLGELTGSYNGTNIEANAEISVFENTTFTFAAENADGISVKAGDAEPIALEVADGSATWTPGLCENAAVTVTATMNADTPETKTLSFDLTVKEKEWSKGWLTVTSVNELRDGDEVTFYAKEFEATNVTVPPVIMKERSSQLILAQEFDYVDNALSVEPYTFVLKKIDTDNWALMHEGKYISQGDKKVNLSDELSDNCKFGISVEDGGNAVVSCGTYSLLYNANQGTSTTVDISKTRFTFYSTSQQPIYMLRRPTVVTPPVEKPDDVVMTYSDDDAEFVTIGDEEITIKEGVALTFTATGATHIAVRNVEDDTPTVIVEEDGESVTWTPTETTIFDVIATNEGGESSFEMTMLTVTSAVPAPGEVMMSYSEEHGEFISIANDDITIEEGVTLTFTAVGATHIEVRDIYDEYVVNILARADGESVSWTPHGDYIFDVLATNEGGESLYPMTMVDIVQFFPDKENLTPVHEEIEVNGGKIVKFTCTKGKLQIMKTLYVPEPETEEPAESIAPRADEGWYAGNQNAKLHHEDLSSLPEGETYTLTAKAVSVDGSKETEPVSVNVTSTGIVVAGVENVAVDAEGAEVEYFNLQGVRVAADQPGIYIMRRGNQVSKVAKY